MRDPIDRRRALADRAATVLATVGGASVLVLLAAMFLFLLREALPLAAEARLTPLASPAPPSGAPPPAPHGGAGTSPASHGLALTLAGPASRLETARGTAAVAFAAPEGALGAFSHTGGSLVLGAGPRLERRVLYRGPDGAWQLSPPSAYAPAPAAVDRLATSPATPHFAVAAGRTLVLYRLPGRSPVAQAPLRAPAEALRWGADGRWVEARTAAGPERFAVVDPYPNATLGTLWTPVHHDFAPEPAFLWQATRTDPAYSLLPLGWGTLKAALVGMVFGAPIAVLAAVHTAFFARPRARRLIKPTLELMEGLPTVMLGLIATMILAPALQRHLLALLVTLVALPLIAATAGLLASAAELRRAGRPERLPWLLLPTLALTLTATFWLGHQLDGVFPGGFVAWLELELGVRYSLRNSLLVGLVVGLAIFPTVFTLAEDAVFGVPDRLARGALALGATRWQALLGVVLPMASPGILAALIIGFARGIGETMIVLMVSGNTPLLDASLFSGLRSAAANLAIELPETSPGSEHYRVLFLSAALLFLGTFALNALAEWVRNRLRRRYRAA